MSDFIARRPLTCIYTLQIVSSLAIAALYVWPVKAADFGPHLFRPAYAEVNHLFGN